MVLLGGALAVARISWKINDVKAKEFGLPDVQVNDMLEENDYSIYVRKVAANALLCFAENVRTSNEIDVLILPLIGRALQLAKDDKSPDGLYVRRRLCAARAY